MSHTHTISFLVAAATAAFSFAAAAQTATISTVTAGAAQVESGASLPQPRSIMQRYEPALPASKVSQLQLLVDDSQADVSQSAPAVQPVAQADEVGTQPAINALRPGRFAITVSQVSRSER